MAIADHIVDMGPGAGKEGGKIVFESVPAKLVKHAASLTGQHLAKRVA
jgi:excinuclease UvrABC ATPase subunit